MPKISIVAEVPMSREEAIQIMAKLLCITANMEQVDSLDGSPNWWMFNGEATKIVDDLRKRFPVDQPSAS
jgi:hypothetical protein